MEPTADPERRRRLVAAAGRALARTRDGYDDEAIAELIRSVRESSDGQEHARDLVLLLFSACSELVTMLGSGGTAPVKMQVVDAGGHELSIDDAEPAVRTAVRTLLAEVHGDDQAAADQVEIALHSASPVEVTSVLLQALRWTLRLSTECLDRGLAVPGWIADALGQ